MPIRAGCAGFAFATCRKNLPMAVERLAYLNTVAGCVANLRGWRRSVVATLLGVLLTAAMPPLFVVPVAFVSFTGLLWLLDGARGEAKPIRASAMVGWWFGFGHFVTGLYWIANALLVDAAQFGWLIPFAIGGLSAYFALFPTAAAAAYGAARGSRVTRILVFAGTWTLAEYLRGVLFSGFSWNLLATTWTFAAIAMQGAAYLGAYGLGLTSILLFAAPAAFGNGSSGRPHRAAVTLAIIGLLPMLVGAGRFALAPGAGVDVEPGVKLALIQGNIAQQMKWLPAERANILQTYLDLTARAVKQGATHVVWPETAVPVALERAGEVRAAIAAILTSGNAKALIAGTIRLSPENAPKLEAWNSVQTFDASGHVIDTYDKAHLVPFGEYVPLRGFLPIERLTAGSVDFSAGPGPETIAVPGLPPVGPMICYEAIFPGAVASRDQRPGLLLNVTNDAWFGDSTGPRQHFAAARMRAVEEGLPLVRDAGTGISAIVDPYGRVLARLDLGQRGIVEGPLPSALPPTLFSRFGNRIALILSLLLLVLGLWRGRKA
jgi:apolipoprotein N-acyltransferase